MVHDFFGRLSPKGENVMKIFGRHSLKGEWFIIFSGDIPQEGKTS
jgi:hypothetical protein